MTLADITSFDVIVMLLVLVFLVRGLWIGFMRQLAAFLALVGSYWVAGRYSSAMMPVMSRFIDSPKLLFLGTFFLLFSVSAILFILSGKVLRRVMEISLLGWFDRFLGLVLGTGKGLLLACLLYMIVAASLSASNTLLKQSLTAPWLAQGAALLQRLIHDEELRRQFLPREPAIPPELNTAVKKLVAPRTGE